LHYYKELRTNKSLQDGYWNTDNVDDEIITEKFKEALKTKHAKSPGEDNLKFREMHEKLLFLITYDDRNAGRMEKQYCPTSIQDR
jgi:hypothetical protein